MAETIFHHTFANGLTLLAERMEHVRSAALNFLVPAGCVHDAPARAGIASVVADMITRGAGKLDSEQLTLALDNLGLDRSESVGVRHMRFWAATVASNIPAALDLYGDILLRPHFPDEELEPARALGLQDLRSLEDEPRSRCLVALRKQYYPAPLSNDHRGTVEGINAIVADDVRNFHRRYFRPNSTIVSVAGNIDWPSLRDQVGRLFADWKPKPDPEVTLGPPPDNRLQLNKETEQTQIALAHASVPISHADFYNAQAAVYVLSGGMSSRLFTEIREKKGLCYAVWATYQSLKERACVISYAGSRNRARPGDAGPAAARAAPIAGRHRAGRGRAGQGRAEVVADHARGIDLGPSRLAGHRLVSLWPGARLRGAEVGHRGLDSRECPGTPAPLSAARLHHRHPGTQAVDHPKLTDSLSPLSPAGRGKRQVPDGEAQSCLFIVTSSTMACN